MEYRNLGASGLRISELGLGSWLTHGGSVAEAASAELIHAAYAAGINFFDTANMYAKGAAEQILGRALRDYARSSYVIGTKVYFAMGDGPNDRGLSRKHIMEQCEASLRRLGTDYIDLYQCHRYDPRTPLEETLRAMDDLVTQGKVLYVGVSDWSAVQIGDALRLAKELNLDRIVSHQPQYNMFFRWIEPDVLPLCEREGIGQVLYSPLAQGVLSGKYKPASAPPADSRAADPNSNMHMGWLIREEHLRQVEQLRPIAARNGLTIPQLALAWNLRHRIVSSCIIGASRLGQIEENIRASGVKLSSEDLAEIETILANKPVPHAG